MITAVVFDLDDTLYAEIDYCHSGFTAVAEYLAESPHTPAAESVFDSLWKQFTSGNRTRTFNTALDELEISYDDKLIRRLVELYRNHVPRITLPADSENVLSELFREYTLALLTDGFLPAQQLKVRALGIEHYFEHIIYTEQLGRQFWKPSPVGFEKLMETINVKPQNAAYVADNEKKDFIAPNELGMLTIQIIRPARIHAESSEESHAPAKHIIHKISQLPPLLHRA